MEDLQIIKNVGSNNSFYYQWINKKTKRKDAGLFMVQIDNDNRAYIAGYKKNKGQPVGIGYEFIKMCIEDVLKSGYDIYSVNDFRSNAANHVWEKIEKIYKVKNIIIKKYKCKLIKNAAVVEW